ncbi:MAG: hypothetical protein ACRDQW_16800 [Haloechinothrix sp.]
MVAKYALDEPEALVRAIYATRSVISRIEDPVDRAQAVRHLAERVGRSTDLSLQAATRDRGGRWADRAPSRTLR